MPKRSISIIFEIVILLLPAGMASAQTTYNVGGGTIVYTGPAPDVLGTTGYDVGTTAPPVDVNGVTLTQTDATHPALVIDNDTDGPLAVTFSGTPSSITGASDALNVIHFGFTETGDVSLDTSGTAGGNTFAAGDYGYGVQVDSDTGAVSNATAILGPDTISSVDGSAVDVESHTGTASLTSAANITGPTGISVFGDTAASVTLSGSVSGTQSSIELDSFGQSTLTLQTGATLTGTAYGSTETGATNTLVLQGTGTTNNNFVSFNTLNVGASGIWALNGNSSIGATTITTDNLQVGDAGHPSAQLNGNVTIESDGTLSGHGTVGGAPVGGPTPVVQNNGGTVSPGGSIGTLAILADYQQTGGQIVFDVDPDGSGGFLESKLLFDPSNTVSIDNTDIVFDFLDNADPQAFFNSGDFNLDTFFQSTSGDPFSNDFHLSDVFVNDSYNVMASNYDVTDFAFTPETGATALSETAVPEPGTLWLILPGLIAIAAFCFRKRSMEGGRLSPQRLD